MESITDRKFWENQFTINQLDIDLIFEYLTKQQLPVSILELTETLIRNRIQRSPFLDNVRVYSPEQKYTINERIFFLGKDGSRKYARVTHIDYGHSHAELHLTSYDVITVRFEIDKSEAKYVSNCPEFPLRFRPYKNSIKEEIYLTPGQLVTEFGEIIIPKLVNALQQDTRFVCFANKWLIKDNLIDLLPEELEKIHQKIRIKRKPLSVNNICEEIWGIDQNNTRYQIYLFSINCALKNDRYRRFVNIGPESEGLWALAPPPRQATITLSDDAVSKGLIKLTLGLKKILDYCLMENEVTFLTYGNYEIKGYLDTENKVVFGIQIKSWYEENFLKAKDKIIIKAPEAFGGIPRIYTPYEKRRVFEPSEEKEKREKIFLRDRIFSILKREGKYLHYKTICKMISKEISVDVRPAVVEAILSVNQHLFTRTAPSRGLWGLKEWTIERTKRGVDLNSLLLAIYEEDWVYKILKENNKPLNAREIANQLAQLFLIPSETILQTTFIDPKDRRLVKSIDDQWALRDWIKLWKQKVAKIQETLNQLNDLRSQLHDLQRQYQQKCEELRKVLAVREKIALDIKLRKQNIESLANKLSKVEKLQWQEEEKLIGLQSCLNCKIWVKVRKTNRWLRLSSITLGITVLIIILLFFSSGLAWLFCLSIAFAFFEFILITLNLWKRKILFRKVKRGMNEISQIKANLSQLENQRKALKTRIKQQETEINKCQDIEEKLMVQLQKIQDDAHLLIAKVNGIKEKIRSQDEATLLKKKQEILFMVKKFVQFTENI